MSAARASGTDLASSLRQNTFLIEEKLIFDTKKSFDLPIASNPSLFFSDSGTGSGSEKMSGSEKIVRIFATLHLEVLSLPEGLVHPGGARCLSSASVAPMLAAASIEVMDALFGVVARSDAEWST